MTYINLGNIGKAIARDMVDRNKKSLQAICKGYKLSYSKIRQLIHDDNKVSIFKLEELKKIKRVFHIEADIILDPIENLIKFY
jgi:hypothetical protein